MSTGNDKPIYIRLDQETYDWLRREAEAQSRPMSSLARLYVTRGLRDGIRYVLDPAANGQDSTPPA